jgi:chromosome segregation ATPase
MRTTKLRIQKAKRDIEEEVQRLEDDGGGHQAIRLQELEDAKVALADAQVAVDEHHSRLSVLEDEARRANDDVEQQRPFLDTKKGDLNALERRLNTLRRDKGDQWTAFHDRMPQLLRALRDERGFHTPPVGPVGSHIRLSDPEWSMVLEKSFGGILNAFLVTSKSDSARLSSIMRRVGW